MRATPIQSLPVPSEKAKASTNRPTSTVRGSRHRLSRLGPEPGVRPRRRWPPGATLAVPASGRKRRTISGTTPTTMTATAIRCAVTGMLNATMIAPSSAPATVPRLNPAWNRGMIARPRCRSTSAPWTFMATSHAPLAKPNRNRPTTTATTPMRYPAPITASAAATSTAITVTVSRVFRRWMMNPDSGRAMTEPAAIASRTRPRAAGERPRWTRTWGMRDAQLAIPKPDAMKAP